MTKLFAACFASCLCLFAQADTEKKLDGQISSALKKVGAPSVSVSVVSGNKLIYAKAFGSADLESHRAADADTRYAVGSVSKQSTVAALLMLHRTT